MTSPKTLLKAWELRPKKRLGQSFLSDPSTAATIAARARLSPQDVVLEIGAGLGALTIPLAQTVKKLYAVEKDHQLIDLLKTELLTHKITNCEIMAGDILQIDLRKFTASADRKITVIGNLPYNISSQILIKLIQSRNDFNRAVFMFQKELAQRIAARPGGKEYGRITAMLRYCAEIRTLLNVKASAFYPQPKIDSAVIEIKFKPTTDYGPHDEAMLFAVIKAAFGNRRKTLKNALAASGLPIDSQTALRALTSAGIDPSRRAETLQPGEFVSLEVCLREAMVQGES
ncbi:SSU rRNA (adenine(1518)-N(6)/adenine(1519)-N(6))-dimethyltransferase (EC [Olavius sp. associated proteobacterium Delta 1]|nr:SSU rRNA (adenine(1518)-N(6)/adenine(1519)-N(6))-dimethyltransferase (EC [Olavius sp. associated proteobacterium Delta 1]